jgi:HAD superfamily phosphatase (TIGR01668 family)
VGKFDQDKAGALRRYCPSRAAYRLQDVSLEELWQSGKRLILLDVDHTIVKWGEEEFSAEVLDWVASAKAMGFQLRILSNTRHPKRLARLSDKIDIPTKNGKFKPSPEMYMEALAETGFVPEQAVMIGDQIMTDILGANRTGIDSIWLQKMEGPEFAGTKINRVIERLVMSLLYRSTMNSESEVAGGRVSIAERPIVRQIGKFLMVGGLSFIIDYMVRYTLMVAVHIGPDPLWKVAGGWIKQNLPIPLIFPESESARDAFLSVAIFLAFIVATLNSFLLNRRFTFKVSGGNRGRQMIKIYLVSAGGFLINYMVSKFVESRMFGTNQHSLLIASVLGAAVAATWNFLGQRYFAFKVHKRV